MVSKKALESVLERLVTAWHDAEAIRDMPELFSEDKLSQIGSATMAAIEEAWTALGHNKQELMAAYQHLWHRGRLENWAGKKHVVLD